ncbi:MAG: hypothetical protein H7328_09680 [Bdellovibrio sp.]|nr:hypothetical protein [Bdellovibrio sp.]
MEKQTSQSNADTLPVIPNPKATPSQGFQPRSKESINVYPEQIPEAQGDLADRANVEIDQELQENIKRARETVDPSREHYKDRH